MKINGIKFNFNVDVAEFDLDLNDIANLARLKHEMCKDMREVEEKASRDRMVAVAKADMIRDVKIETDDIVGALTGVIKDVVKKAISEKLTK